MKRTIAESKSSPPTIQKISKNNYYYNYNIKEVEKEIEGGENTEVLKTDGSGALEWVAN